MNDMLCGIDRREIWLPLLKGKRICVLTHAPAVDANYVRSADVLAQALNVTALCGPEHGLDGLAQAGVGVGFARDTGTGLPVYSLFPGKEGGPSLADALAEADAAVCDFCDIGVRFYTYIWSMTDAMKICAEKGVPFYVLDRPNPVGGVRCEGTLLEPAFASFVGRFPIPVRHALTLGEAARLCNERFAIGCKLAVIPVKNWVRSCEFEDTGRVWVNPSPNMPNPDCARIFCGTCFLEGTNVSEGRGTTRPYELVGAPFVDAEALARRLNSYRIPGVLARACRFKPTADKHAGEVCGGVQFLLTDRKNAECFAAGVRLVDILRNDCSEFEYGDRAKHFDQLLGSDRFRKGKITADELIEQGREESREFLRSAREFMLYPDR